MAAVSDLVGFFRGCPRSSDDQDTGRVHEVRRTATGGESWALITTYAYGDHPTPGLDVVHVVRLGRAVLIDRAATHGSPEHLDELLQRMTAESAPVVAAMCAFTAAGC